MQENAANPVATGGGGGTSARRAPVLICNDTPGEQRWQIQTVTDLACEARQRADRAGFLAICCELTGDLAGALGWYRQEAKHLRVGLAAMDPGQGPEGGGT